MKGCGGVAWGRIGAPKGAVPWPCQAGTLRHRLPCLRRQRALCPRAARRGHAGGCHASASITIRGWNMQRLPADTADIVAVAASDHILSAIVAVTFTLCPRAAEPDAASSCLDTEQVREYSEDCAVCICVCAHTLLLTRRHTDISDRDRQMFNLIPYSMEKLDLEQVDSALFYLHSYCVECET